MSIGEDKPATNVLGLKDETFCLFYINLWSISNFVFKRAKLSFAVAVGNEKVKLIQDSIEEKVLNNLV